MIKIIQKENIEIVFYKIETAEVIQSLIIMDK